MELPPVFERYRDAIEAELEAVLAGREGPLYGMVRYQLGWADESGQPVSMGGGKRVRPVLCLLACEALGGDHRPGLPAAAAVELVHNFSLIHDDIQDGSPQRHQRPTLWWVWGPGQAINAGDGMHALGRLALFRLEEQEVPPQKVTQALQVLDEACLRLCEGQHLDLAFQERVDVSLNAYFDMASRKTAALMACALELGALVASDEPEVIKAFRRCGHSLGMAFQIRDDILDLWGNHGGSTISGDLLNKSKVLPVVYALQQGEVRQKRELGTLYLKRVLEPADMGRITAILDELGAREYAQDMAWQHYQQAVEALKDVPLLPTWREQIDGVMQFLVTRNS